MHVHNISIPPLPKLLLPTPLSKSISSIASSSPSSTLRPAKKLTPQFSSPLAPPPSFGNIYKRAQPLQHGTRNIVLFDHIHCIHFLTPLFCKESGSDQVTRPLKGNSSLAQASHYPCVFSSYQPRTENREPRSNHPSQHPTTSESQNENPTKIPHK